MNDLENKNKANKILHNFINELNVRDNSKKNYEVIIDRIDYFQSNNKCSIFEFDESQITDFILNSITPGMRNTANAILTKYYEYYIKNEELTNTNNILDLIKDRKLIEKIYYNKLSLYILSITELINIVKKIKQKIRQTNKQIQINNRDLAITILSYMGFNPKLICNLKVGNLDFENKEIKIDNLRYYNINTDIFNIISNNIDKKDNENYIFKTTTGKPLIENTIHQIIKRLTDSTTKALNTKSLQDAGSLVYYCTHEDKVTQGDKDIQMLKIYKEFHIINKGVYASRFSLCNDVFDYKINILKPMINDMSIMFDVDIDLSDEDIQGMKTNKKNRNLLEEMKQAYPEDEREENDKQDSRYQKQKEIGNKAENLVKNILENKEGIYNVKLMKDYTGYDIQFKLDNKIHRVEVKAIKKDLKFHMTLNEINNLFNPDRENFVIAFVLQSILEDKIEIAQKSIKILKNVNDRFKIDDKFVYNSLHNKNIEIVSESFKMKLDNKVFKQLDNINDYIDLLKINRI